MSRIEAQARRIRELCEENEALRDRIEHLESAIAERVPLVLWAELTPAERVIVGLLISRDTVSRDLMHAFLYSAKAGGGADIKVCDVFICKIRKKLTPLGVDIETVRGIGWRMARGRDVLDAMTTVAA